MIPEAPSSATIGNSSRESPIDESLVLRVEARHQERRDQDEERRQRAEPEQHQPEQARRDAPRALALALLEQVAEDRHERGGDGGVGDERPHRVRNEERDLEGVDLAVDAEVVLGHDLAEEAEHARDAGREREDRRRPGEPAGVGAGERELVRLGAGIGALARAGGGHVVTAAHDTRHCGRSGSLAGGLCYHRRARSRGRFHAMANITQQKKRIRTAADQRLENLRYRSTIKTLTKRLATAVDEGDAATVETEHKGLVKLDRSRGRTRRAAPEHRSAQEVAGGAARLVRRIAPLLFSPVRMVQPRWRAPPHREPRSRLDAATASYADSPSGEPAVNALRRDGVRARPAVRSRSARARARARLPRREPPFSA